MALYLVQHGKSHYKNVDPQRGLTDEGISEVKRIAEAAGKNDVKISCIKHSGKTRALQTAEIFAQTLIPEKGVQEESGINPMDDVVAYAGKLDSSENIMLVGHLPFMEKLSAYLITGSADSPVLKFQNGGIVALDLYPDTKSWVIKWALMPDIS